MNALQPSATKKLFLLSALTGLLATLTACSSTSDGQTNALQCPNPAIKIDYPRDTLKVESNLERYQFDDFLRASAPRTTLDNPNALALLDFLTGKIKQATNFTGTAASPESYTNSMDLLESIIATDELSNLTTARSQMRYAIDNNIGCRYNNQNVQINDGTHEFRYLVDFNYVPVTSEGNDPFVSRTLVEFGTSNNSEEDPGNASDLFFSGAASLTTYDPASFTQQGYNTPRSVIASWSLGETESVTINKDYQKTKQDEVEYSNETATTVEPLTEPVKRVKFVVDYRSAEVRIFTSEFRTAVYGPTGEILQDQTKEQLAALQEANPTWVAVNYEDPGYDGESPTPRLRYEGIEVSHRF